MRILTLSDIFSRIIKRVKQGWCWKLQYFPVFGDDDYYPEWQKLSLNSMTKVSHTLALRVEEIDLQLPQTEW